MEISLYCESPACTETRRPCGKKSYVIKRHKQTIDLKEFRPGTHKCPQCNCMMITNQKRKNVIRRDMR